MKQLILTFILLVYINSVNAQDFKDLIVTETNDSIQCTITLLNESNFFYDHKLKKDVVNDMIPVNKVKFYTYGGVMGNLKKEIVKESPSKKSESLTSESSSGINLNLRKASNLLSVGGGSIILGGIVSIIQSTAKVPSFSDYNDIQQYNDAIEGYNHTQKVMKITSASFFSFAGLFIMAGGSNLYRTTKKENKVARIMPSSDGLSLVFNIK